MYFLAMNDYNLKELSFLQPACCVLYARLYYYKCDNIYITFVLLQHNCKVYNHDTEA
ncbi:hypothetical protein Barb6XT_00927 [Bacteroidales bacterium Barb6XT]|nr:hypothetical protein Barb6XT_00927 [Bacteroidales bacterium Barb6XT]